MYWLWSWKYVSFSREQQGVFVRHHRYQKKKHGAHVAFCQTEVGIKHLKRQALHFTPGKLRSQKIRSFTSTLPYIQGGSNMTGTICV